MDDKSDDFWRSRTLKQCFYDVVSNPYDQWAYNIFIKISVNHTTLKNLKIAREFIFANYRGINKNYLRDQIIFETKITVKEIIFSLYDVTLDVKMQLLLIETVSLF